MSRLPWGVWLAGVDLLGTPLLCTYVEALYDTLYIQRRSKLVRGEERNNSYARPTRMFLDQADDDGIERSWDSPLSSRSTDIKNRIPGGAASHSHAESGTIPP